VLQNAYKEMARIGLHYAEQELVVSRAEYPHIRFRKDPTVKDYDLHINMPTTGDSRYVSVTRFE
jgi:hypothetical protein